MDPRFDVGREHGAIVLRIRGDLDIAVEDDAVDAVSKALAAADPPPAHLVLDLSEVEFMDSSGLRALLRIHNRHGDQIRLGPVSAVVERLLELTGTLDLFAPGDGSATA
jgi:anti-sigma B factor antagonist